MANHLDNERAQRDAFLQTTQALFSQWLTETSQGATASARTDITISVDGSTMLLIEIKEWKGGRRIDASLSSLRNNNRSIKGHKSELLSPWCSNTHSMLERSVFYLEQKVHY